MWFNKIMHKVYLVFAGHLHISRIDIVCTIMRISADLKRKSFINRRKQQYRYYTGVVCKANQ